MNVLNVNVGIVVIPQDVADVFIEKYCMLILYLLSLSKGWYELQFDFGVDRVWKTLVIDVYHIYWELRRSPFLLRFYRQLYFPLFDTTGGSILVIYPLQVGTLDLNIPLARSRFSNEMGIFFDMFGQIQIFRLGIEGEFWQWYNFLTFLPF